MKYINLVRAEETVVITITREEAMNVLNLELLRELEQTIDQVVDEKTGSIILTGAGKKAFVAGADIEIMKDFTRAQAKEFAMFGNRVFRKIEQLPIPVIAAVNGYALGGGLELALACDFRIASANAIFGLPELTLGIIPGFGGTQRLTRTIPVGYAKEMIYTSTRINAEKALQLGLINDLVPQDELLDHALAIAAKIRNNCTYAVQNAKRAMDEGLFLQIDQALDIESNLFAECFEEPEQVTRMQDFVDKKMKRR